MNGKRKVRDSKKRSIDHRKQNSVKLVCQRRQMEKAYLQIFFFLNQLSEVQQTNYRRYN